MAPANSSRDDTPAGRPRGDIGGAGGAPTSREDEAHDTRSGRPMPEEDAADRTEHHKGSYGGEHGEPREPSEPPDQDESDVK